MSRIQTLTRTVYVGKPGKTRFSKRWAYIDAAWHSMRQRCYCEPDEHIGNGLYGGGIECEFHKRLRDKGTQEVGPEGDYIESIPPRSGIEYFKRVANRLAAIYMAQDRRAR